MDRRNFLPSVWEQIKDRLTPEEVVATRMWLYTMRITPELGKKLCEYIAKENLATFHQSRKNGRQIDFTYTPHFSVKLYVRDDGSYSSCYIDGGAHGYSRKDEYAAKASKCMTKLDVYFAILTKYPQHLLEVSYGTKTENCSGTDAEVAKESHDETVLDSLEQRIFDHLRSWRMEAARKNDIPAYLIFNDATLREIAKVRPSTLDKLRVVPGVGERKMVSYGSEIINLVIQLS